MTFLSCSRHEGTCSWGLLSTCVPIEQTGTQRTQREDTDLETTFFCVRYSSPRMFFH